MYRTKKLSGAEFKKKRKQPLESDEKLQNCFNWLLTNSSVEKQIISEDICIEVNDKSTDEVFQTTLINDLSSLRSSIGII